MAKLNNKKNQIREEVKDCLLAAVFGLLLAALFIHGLDISPCTKKVKKEMGVVQQVQK